MKKAEDIVMDMPQDSDGWQSVFRYKDVVNAIKQAQLDAIEETVKLCAENAQVEVVDREELYISSLPGYDRKIDQVILPIYRVDEESILNCTDILKKELK